MPAQLDTLQVEQPVIYGEDERRDWYATTDEMLRQISLASTVALLRENSLQRSESGEFNLHTVSLGDALGLCDSEAFLAQPSASSCSGVIIDDDLVLTAAHCVVDTECQNQTWAFDFVMRDEINWPTINEEALFRCRSVPLRRYELDADGSRLDYAFVQLERPIGAQRGAVAVSVASPSVGMLSTVIGYPSGLPVKVDSNATVRDSRASYRDYFAIASDTFNGSSGSGVFDQKGDLLGIHVRGRSDYAYDGDRRCYVSNRVPETPVSTSFEEASYASRAVESLCAAGWASLRLCRRLGRCGDHQCGLDEHAGRCESDCTPLPGSPTRSIPGTGCNSLSQVGNCRGIDLFVLVVLFGYIRLAQRSKRKGLLNGPRFLRLIRSKQSVDRCASGGRV